MRAEHHITAERPITTTEAERLFAIGEPSLKNLSHVLRHQELWPDGFEWDYASCHSCAMGLAHQLWSLVDSPNSHVIARVFGMPPGLAGRIFGGNHTLCTYGTAYFPDVTPEMVADQIDAYLAEVR
jgi:hypothetical protein